MDKGILTKFRNEIDRMLVDNRMLVDKDGIQSSKLSKSFIQQGDLTTRENDILGYIRLNPGITKQGIIDHFDHEGLGKYSRVTMFKTISQLEKYGLIVVRPNQNNIQIHHLYDNKESILSSLIEDYEAFKNAFFILLDKAKEKYIEFEKCATNLDYPYDFQKRYSASQLLDIYRYFIDLNSLRILFNWSPQTEDPQISEKIFFISFNRIKEIQIKLSEVMKEVVTIEDNYNEFADILLCGGGYTIDKFLINLFKIFKNMNMESEIRDVMQYLLKFGEGLLPLEEILVRLRQEGIILKEFQ